MIRVPRWAVVAVAASTILAPTSAFGSSLFLEALVWLGGHVLGHILDGIFDAVTGKADVKELDRRLAELENSAPSMAQYIKRIRKSLDPEMTREQYEDTVLQLMRSLASKIEDHERRLSAVERYLQIVPEHTPEVRSFPPSVDADSNSRIPQPNGSQSTRSSTLRHPHFLGAVIQPVSAAIANSRGIPQGLGVIVASINKDGPADRAGLLPGDVVTSFGRTDIHDAVQFCELVKTSSGSEDVLLQYYRGGKYDAVRVRTACLLGCGFDSSAVEVAGHHGFRITSLSPDTIGSSIGLEVGDVVVKVNDTDLSSLDRLTTAQCCRPTTVLIVRKGLVRHMSEQ